MRLLALVLPLAFLMAGVAGAAESSDEIVAKMGAIELRRTDVKQLAEGQGLNLKGDRQAVALALEQTVRAELIRRYVLGEAKQKQWDKRPEVQTQIERARDQALVVSYMNHLARPAAEFPSEEEIKVAYEANRARFATPAQYRLAQIYLSGAGDKSAAAERKADEAWKKATDKNANFADVARDLSEHKESATQGGDMGWLTEDQLLPEFRATLKGAATGAVLRPVHSKTGWHVLKLMERKEAGQRSLSEVREALVQALRAQAAQQKERDYMNEIIAKHAMTVNEIALSGLVDSGR